MVTLHAIRRLIFPSDDGVGMRPEVLRHARGELRKFIRAHEGRRLPRMRVWLSTNLLPSVDRANEIATLRETLGRYATELAVEIGTAASARLDVKPLPTIADTIVVQRVHVAAAFTTALMPRRLETGDLGGAPACATVAVFSVSEALVPGGEIEVPSEHIIGRLDGAQIAVVASPRVSSRHARVTISGGVVTVTDEGSRNGSFVGSRRLDPHVGHRLAVGDTLQIADVRLKLEDVR